MIWWAPRLSDKLGRKKAVLIGSVMNTVLYVGLLTTQSKYVLTGIVFLFGANLPLSLNISFVYLLELTPSRSQTTVSTVQNIAATFTVTTNILYFAYVSKNWIWFVFVGFLMQVAQLLTLWLIPESPRQLLASRDQDEAIKALNRIAVINRAAMLSPEQVSRLKESRTCDLGVRESVCLAVREGKTPQNLFVMVVVFTTVATDYYLISFLSVTFK